MPAPLPQTAPIVGADTEAALQHVRQMLGGRVQLAGAHTVAQAKAAITGDTPLVLCGCHFDEGRMYDLLRYMKARPQLEFVPFLAIRLLEGELEDALYESVKIATSALGGHGFIDLLRWQRLYGHEVASRQFSEAVAALVFGSSLPGSLEN